MARWNPGEDRLMEDMYAAVSRSAKERLFVPLVETIVRLKGNESEKHGLQFGLYPQWAVEEANRLLAKLF